MNIIAYNVIDIVCNLYPLQWFTLGQVEAKKSTKRLPPPPPPVPVPVPAQVPAPVPIVEHWQLTAIRTSKPFKSRNNIYIKYLYTIRDYNIIYYNNI